ncbi:uncharacterized protein ColSpa_04115 [Colletotrichum spaethianum]|uniref:Uncharacterized protein n=1 Tax=Colletotrichum spaethianum TaxID=700344 RepID=A0AA37LCA9_9PEZI|nr:uncharacterized protein ColSpa_04115 [Colletotrichum spaethianum]GKT43934.1 hypothetical protein ColSpa_04115 [Colletotrichum spaethianum]
MHPERLLRYRTPSYRSSSLRARKGQPGIMESRASRPPGHDVPAVMDKPSEVPHCGLSPERRPFPSGSSP